VSSEVITLVLTTIGASADGDRFARTLVEERLAACVNVLPPMRSTYRWKGMVEQDDERQIVIKTTADRIDLLRTRVRELHPYEMPEFIVLRVADGERSYLDWIIESVGPTQA
jgi:periplasmic divalent cation tolerance protein